MTTIMGDAGRTPTEHIVPHLARVAHIVGSQQGTIVHDGLALLLFGSVAIATVAGRPTFRSASVSYCTSDIEEGIDSSELPVIIRDKEGRDTRITVVYRGPSNAEGRNDPHDDDAHRCPHSQHSRRHRGR